MYEIGAGVAARPRLKLRPAEQRGRARLGWLDSRHTFSFAGYWDPDHVGFRSLRVINDDRVEPGHGFGSHPHDNTEILSVVVSGALEHRDSLDTGSVIRPGEVQRMSAGTGILHSERNPSRSEPVHFLQIWIEPERRGLAPGYEQRRFDETPDRLVVVACRDGRDGALTVHQDVVVLRGRLSDGGCVSYQLAVGRHAWLHVIEGAVEVNGVQLAAGDGGSTSDAGVLDLRSESGADLLLFDLA